MMFHTPYRRDSYWYFRIQFGAAIHSTSRRSSAAGLVCANTTARFECDAARPTRLKAIEHADDQADGFVLAAGVPVGDVGDVLELETHGEPFLQ